MPCEDPQILIQVVIGQADRREPEGRGDGGRAPRCQFCAQTDWLGSVGTLSA